MFKRPCTTLLLLLVLASITACAKPFIPSNDDTVLERLPEKGDPRLAQLKRMRAALS